MKEFELKIEYLPVDSLTPYEKNTRKHSPTDIEGISLAIQGYNFGDGYITWALEKDGKYTEKNAKDFSNMMEKKLNMNGYGDIHYVKHVLRYYPYL